MENKFDRRLKDVEQELTDLKTAMEYTSVRSARYSYGTSVYSGTYRLTYEPSDEPIFSIISASIAGEVGGVVGEHTPTNNHQVIEVNTYYYDGSSYIVEQAQLSVVSNRAVTAVERIS